MRIAGKFVGASAALFLGSVMFLAPDIVTGPKPGTGALPVDSASAGPDAATIGWIEALNDADDAWFEAAMDIERSGQTPSSMARLKAADDAYFETVMAIEAARDEARQIARIEAADDAYFEAAMMIEITGGTEEHRASLEAADDAWFEAAIALESNKEIVTGLARLKAREELDAATRLAFSRLDTVTGSLPRDAAAAEAAEAMTVRIEGGGPSGVAAAIAPERAEDMPEAGITASVTPPGADAPAEAGAAPREGARALAARKKAPAYRPARRANAAPRFRDRGPVAKVFRIFVMGVGFLPSQL